MTLRNIKNSDNEELAALLRSVLVEMGVPKVGTAYEDPELDQMFETYQVAKSAYFVIEEAGKLQGGAGIAPLREGPEEICELQKMYFSPEARGKKWGDQMIEHCLSYAQVQGFKRCYIETMPYMKAAQKLYQKKGFEYIDGAMGSTGHTNCSGWMIKTL